MGKSNNCLHKLTLTKYYILGQTIQHKFINNSSEKPSLLFVVLSAFFLYFSLKQDLRAKYVMNTNRDATVGNFAHSYDQKTLKCLDRQNSYSKSEIAEIGIVQIEISHYTKKAKIKTKIKQCQQRMIGLINYVRKDMGLNRQAGQYPCFINNIFLIVKDNRIIASYSYSFLSAQSSYIPQWHIQLAIFFIRINPEQINFLKVKQTVLNILFIIKSSSSLSLSNSIFISFSISPSFPFFQDINLYLLRVQLHQLMKQIMSVYMRSLSLFLLFSFILVSAFTASAPPTWVGTNYIQAGIKIIYLSGNNQNGTYIYQYTYSPAYSQAPYTALGLIGLQSTTLQQYLLKFLINIPNFTSSTSLQIRLTVPTSSWRNFRASYIAIDKVFNQVKVDYFSVSNPANVGTGIGTRVCSGVFTFGIPAVDITHKISIIPLLIGLESHSVNGQHAFYFDTKIKTANSINYNITADRTTHIYSFVAYILVVDRTNTEVGYQKFMDELYIGGKNNIPIYQTPVFYNSTNMHAGLNGARFTLVAFNFDKSSFSITTQGYYQFLNISVWSYRERNCDPLLPYYEIVSNLCYDNCPAGYVNRNGPTKKYCQACSTLINACIDCSGPSTCTNCVGNYVVNIGSCDCPTGFYQDLSYSDFSQRCRPCDPKCLACSGGSSNQCTSCAPGKSLSNGSCSCANRATTTGACFLGNCAQPSCLQCNQNTNICQICESSFNLTGARCTCQKNKYYDRNTITCRSCHYTCEYCSGPSINECSSCDRLNQHRYLNQNHECKCIQGYEQNNSTCVQSLSSDCSQPGYSIDPTTLECKQICGDGNRINYQCDDGNTNDGDGCSKECMIQTGFICSENVLAPNRMSFCSYTSQININLLSITKDIYQNSLHMNFTFDPNLDYVLKKYSNLTESLTFINPVIKTYSAEYKPESTIVNLIANYTENIHQKEIMLNFKMPETALTYAIPVSNSYLKVLPNNSLAADLHPPEKYNSIGIFKIIGFVSQYGGLVTFIASLFFRKMIGLQYLISLQFIYFSIMLSEYSYAYFGPVQEWVYINGYNQLKSGITSAKLVSNKFWVLGYFDYFHVNVNAMLYVILANYALALIIYGLSVLSDRAVSRKLLTVSIFFAVDIGFGLLMMCLNNIFVSIFLQSHAGHIMQFTFGLNKFFVILSLLLVIGQVGAYIYKIHDLTDSQLYYHRNKNYCHFYPLVFLARNLVVITFIVLGYMMSNVSSIVALSIQVVYIVLIFVGRPYKRIIDYVRMVIVQLTFTILLVLRVIQANSIPDFSSVDPNISSFLEKGSIVVYSGLLLGLIISWISFGFHLWKGRSQQIEVNPEKNGDDDVGIEPITMGKSQELLRQIEYQQPQKSKQILMVEDVEQGSREQGTGYQNLDIFQDSKKKLRGKKMKKSKKEETFYN